MSGGDARIDPAELTPIRVGHRWGAIDDGGGLLLVVDPADIRWLSGFTGSAGGLLVDLDGGSGVLFTDARYGEQARAEAASVGAPVDVEVSRSRAASASALAEAVTGRSVKVDPRHVSVARWQELRGMLPDVVLEQSPIGDARRRKDPAEIDRMRAGATIATAALAEVIATGLEGLSERHVARLLEDGMIARGAEGPAYPTIVASGPNAAMAHHRPGDRIIADGDVVVIDVGARVDGYCSDMTRSFFVGEVDARLVEMYDTVIESQRTGVEAVRAGATAHEVDRACREVFVAAGVSEFYVHGTGHGVGLEIHEHPILSPGVDVELLVDEVVTVEPGLYREGLGGVRTEDLVVVSREGATSLTHAPKDPTCPPSPRTT